ncbi:MAG: hypothetical protein GQ570_04455 [Helicobacteraceae bacterium]|nr:hypothetical protein [Helicobacteraceae bacterium]
MKLILLIFIFNSLLLATDVKDSEQKKREAIELKKAMDKEKKYAKEQIFYSTHNYDFKSAEVNRDTLDSVPDIEVDDMDMDDVYD